jgi:hypothetical protein
MKIITIMLLALAAMACASEVNELPTCAVSADTLTYFKNVYPILNVTCALPDCHVNGFEHGNFKDASHVRELARNGKLEFMITSRQMPPGYTNGPASLTDCEINIIKTWINNGAQVK